MKQSTNKVKITAYSFSMHLGKVINFKQMSVLFVVFAGVTFVCFFSVLLLFNAFFYSFIGLLVNLMYGRNDENVIIFFSLLLFHSVTAFLSIDATNVI